MDVVRVRGVGSGEWAIDFKDISIGETVKYSITFINMIMSDIFIFTNPLVY